MRFPRSWDSTGRDFSAADKLSEITRLLDSDEYNPRRGAALRAVAFDYDVDRSKRLVAIEQEIAQRKRTYPRLVQKGELKEEEAILRIDILRAIARDYRTKNGGG